MSFNADSALDDLAMVIGAIQESAGLQTWFQNLAQMPEDARREAIVRITGEMKAQHEPEDVVNAFGLLTHPYFFNAVTSALEDFGIDVRPGQ